MSKKATSSKLSVTNLPKELRYIINQSARLNAPGVPRRFADIVPVSIWDSGQRQVRTGYQLHVDKSFPLSPTQLILLKGLLSRNSQENMHHQIHTLKEINNSLRRTEFIGPIVKVPRNNGVIELYAYAVEDGTLRWNFPGPRAPYRLEGHPLGQLARTSKAMRQ